MTGYGTEVQGLIGVLDLFVGDTDIIQGSSNGAVTEHLLEEKELTRVIVALEHLVIAKGLTERMGRHVNTKAKIVIDTLQNPVNGFTVHRGVVLTAIVALRAEHVIGEGYSRGILQVEENSVHDGIVNGDVTIALVLLGVPGLDLPYSECGAEVEGIVDDIRELEQSQVTDPETEVDPDDEEHIVTVALIFNEVRGYAVNISRILDWFGRMVDEGIILGIFDSRSYQARKGSIGTLA